MIAVTFSRPSALATRGVAFAYPPPLRHPTDSTGTSMSRVLAPPTEPVLQYASPASVLG